jgi:hypothetical protein
MKLRMKQSMKLLKPLWVTLVLVSTVGGAACSNPSPGASTTPPVIVPSGPNVLPVTVNLGPLNFSDNIAYTSVTICAPGSTTSCQTINGIQLDTGSSGLRILSSAISIPLPQETDASGNPIVECLQFVASYSWGSVRMADVQMASEQAHNLPIQLIGDPQFPAVPDSCSGTGPSADTVQTFGANGLLGVGVFRQDCGIDCSFAGAANPNFYFTCPGAVCQPANVSLAQQVPNPVWLLPVDNNGVIVELPAVSASGEATASGSLVFGIGTQSNNTLGVAKVFTTDADGQVTTVYKGVSYGGSEFDTGSDALYFLDSGTAGLPLCRDASGYYCPTTVQSQSATVQGLNNATSAIAFSVANADTLFSNAVLSAFSNLAGPNAGAFDWGLPFFYGRNVFVGIESQSTSAGPGPYWAF